MNSNDKPGPYSFLKFSPTKRIAFFSELYKDALDPYRHLDKTARAKMVYQDQTRPDPFNPQLLAVTDKMIVYLHNVVNAYPDRAIELKDLEIKEYFVDNLRIKMHLIDKPRSGIITECYNDRNQLILFYRAGIKYFDIDHLKGLGDERHRTYFDGSENSLHVFEYDINGKLKKVVQYHTSDGPLEQTSYFEDLTDKKLPAPIPLLDSATALSSPMIAPDDLKGINKDKMAYYRAYSDRSCNHNHICCQAGCPCCNGQKNITPGKIDLSKVKIAKPSPDFTKQLKNKITLQVFLGDDLFIRNPRYEFIEPNGKKTIYYSTLSNQAFISGILGDTRFSEYDENELAWVMKSDREIFCRINKQGMEVPLAIDGSLLGTANISNSKLSDNLYAVGLTLHEHLPDINDNDRNPIIITALVDRDGKLVNGDIRLRTIRKITDSSFVLGEYKPGMVSIGDSWEQPGLKYFVTDKAFKKLSEKSYDVIDYHWSEGLAKVRNSKGYGFINTAGQELIPCQYSNAGSFFPRNKSAGFLGGLAFVWTGNKSGAINARGELVIPILYDKISGFSEGLSVVKMGRHYGYIDTTGNVAIPCIYETANNFSRGKALVQIKNDSGKNESFYINQKGEFVENK